MKTPIPESNEGEWQCYQIYWPPGLEWLAILRGLLTMPMRGRYWDERTGSILAVQDIAWEIFNRNIALNSCAVPGQDTTITIQNIINAFDDAGEDSEDMAVQKVYVDCETGELVVDYGGCNGECRFDLSCITTKTPPPPDEYTPPGGGEGGDTYYACAKAYAAVRTVMQMAESIFVHCDDITLTPWKDIQAENEGIEIHKSPSGWLALTYALGLKTLNFEWADQADLEQQYLCQAVNLFTSTKDDDLANDETWDKFTAIFRGAYVGNFAWGSLFDYVIGAGVSGGPGVIGREQLEELTVANAGDDTRNCDCPEIPDAELPDGYDWVYSWEFDAGHTDWVLGENTLQTSEGIHRDTVSGQYNLFNFSAVADAISADSTTKLKYAKLWVDGGAVELDNNSDALTIDSTPEVVLVPISALKTGVNYWGGAKTYQWASANGESLEGFGLRFAYTGYEWPEGTAKFRVMRVVVAGDGTPPYQTL